METVPNPVASEGDILLKVRMVGFCGSDLNSFRGLNPLVSFPRIPGHEVSATVVHGDGKEPVSCETRLFVQKELDILGSRNALLEDFRAVISLLEARKFPVDQAVSLVVPLEDSANALRSWSETPSRSKKILVSLD